MNTSFSYFLMSWLNPKLLLLVAAGTFSGVYVGAIPGLSVTMAVSLLISFTFSWDVNEALALMVGIYCGGVYGGSRSAILLNIPGAPAAIATAFDGFPLAKKGEAGVAIGLTTVISVAGGIIGIIFLSIGGPLISEFSLQFAPRDYMLMAVMGILLVGCLSGKSIYKGFMAGSLGLLLGLVGMDPLTGQGRFTFGSVQLLGGIHYVVAMIGLFGVSEALSQIRNAGAKPVQQRVDRIIPPWKWIVEHLPLAVKSSVIGVFIGALPGTGGDIAALLAYGYAKRSVKEPSVPFGEGAYEGLVAPESANNAAIGGAYIPMLTLGIPGDAVTAVMIGALYVHGLRPGPMLMIETPHLFWFIVGALVLANVFLLVFGLTGIRIFTRMIELPKGILIPMIVVLSVVGTYSINNNLTEVWWMLGIGTVGYVLRMYGFQMGPIVLGIILGPLLDMSYRRAMMSVQNDPLAFGRDLISHPISLTLTLGIVWMILAQTSLPSRCFASWKEWRLSDRIDDEEW
jgi:putative tricarboxylic transport membrane protein